MRILVVGGGGREHAICRALATGRERPDILIAPGNPGTKTFGLNLDVRADSVVKLASVAKTERVDLVVPGPETPLALGLADRLGKLGIACCGPSAAAARLESSKAFTRELCSGLGVPQPRFVVVTQAVDLPASLRKFEHPPVVKADGLAAGKGVVVPETMAEAEKAATDFLSGTLGTAGRTVVLEERLYGTEASLFYAVSGTSALALPDARDHKRLFDGDHGPNTGGMGAISPNPAIDKTLATTVQRHIVAPVLRALADSKTPYHGFLYVGIILTPQGPSLLEFNVRLGDPEAQAILPRLAPGNFAEICCAIADDRLGDVLVEIDPRPTCAVVLATAGYPVKPRLGVPIARQAYLENEDRWLDHAGTRERDGRLVTAGGRVACIVARGEDGPEAHERAYQGVEAVHFDGMQVRRDIGITKDS